MPSRVIRGEINASRSLACVSLEADLTFRALIVAVDDYGRMEADPLVLKAALFPRRPKVTPERVAAYVQELAEEGCVQLYRVAGVLYLQLVNWEVYRGKQNRSKESRYPAPPASGSRHEPPKSDPGISGNLPESPASVGLGLGLGEGLGEGGGGVEGDAPSALPGAGAPAPPQGSALDPEPEPGGRRARGFTDPPAEGSQELDSLVLDAEFWCLEHPAEAGALGEGGEGVRHAVNACLDWHRANGKRRKDWEAAVRNWIRKEATLAKSKANARAGDEVLAHRARLRAIENTAGRRP
jgi:hypothetical protein